MKKNVQNIKYEKARKKLILSDFIIYVFKISELTGIGAYRANLYAHYYRRYDFPCEFLSLLTWIRFKLFFQLFSSIFNAILNKNGDHSIIDASIWKCAKCFEIPTPKCALWNKTLHSCNKKSFASKIHNFRTKNTRKDP